jgi:arsenate reductase
MAMAKITVLFLCVGNAARSQMAEGLANALLGDKVQAFSAGNAPAGRVSARAVEVMKEIGIDISGQRSKHLNEFQGREFDYVITLCETDGESCPYFPARLKNLHLPLPDPGAASGSREETLVIFRRVRDQIRQSLLELFS